MLSLLDLPIVEKIIFIPGNHDYNINRTDDGSLDLISAALCQFNNTIKTKYSAGDIIDVTISGVSHDHV